MTANKLQCLGDFVLDYLTDQNLSGVIYSTESEFLSSKSSKKIEWLARKLIVYTKAAFFQDWVWKKHNIYLKMKIKL